MTKEELITKINEVLAEEFEVEKNIIEPEKPLMQTLELDSLDLVDMVVLIENNFGYKMTAEDFAGIINFQNLYDFLFQKTQEKSQ